MKRRRRVEIRIEHHEVSIFAGPPAYPSQPPGPVQPEAADESSVAALLPRGGLLDTGGMRSRNAQSRNLDAKKPESCPICGSQELILLADAIALAELIHPSLKAGLENGAYHLHCSLSGEWWVCGQSLHPG